PPPVVEIAHEAARLTGLALRPTLVVRQAVEQRMARDGQELLALGRPRRRLRRRRAVLERAPDSALPCRSCQRHVVPRRPLNLPTARDLRRPHPPATSPRPTLKSEPDGRFHTWWARRSEASPPLGPLCDAKPTAAAALSAGAQRSCRRPASAPPFRSR